MCIEPVFNFSTKVIQRIRESYSKLKGHAPLGLEIKKLSSDVIQTVNAAQPPKRLMDYGAVLPSDFFEVYPRLSRTFYKHANSKPLKSFEPYINNLTLQQGLSTKPNIGGVFLRGNQSRPLGTSGVGDCAVIFMYNAPLKTHSLYHSYRFTSLDDVVMELKKVMPEGFDKVIIVPGSNSATKETASTLFDAAKKINKDAVVEFKHSETVLEQAKRLEDITGAPWQSEFISYKGDVYEMPLNSNYKPLFKIK